MTLRIFREGNWPFPDLVEFKMENLPDVFSSGMKCLKSYEQEQIKKKTLRLSFLDSKVRWIYYFEEKVENKHKEAYFDTNAVQAVILYTIYARRPERVSFQLLCDLYPQVKPSLIKQSIVKMVLKLLLRHKWPRTC